MGALPGFERLGSLFRRCHRVLFDSDRLTDRTLSCAAKAHVPKPEWRDAVTVTMK
jgi:hypothetical protein